MGTEYFHELEVGSRLSIFVVHAADFSIVQSANVLLEQMMRILPCLDDNAQKGFVRRVNNLVRPSNALDP